MVQGILIGIATGIGLYAIGSLVKDFALYCLHTPGPAAKEAEARREESARKESRPSSESVHRGKHWFLVQTKKGDLKLLQAQKETPKTVAGPFPTKQAAVNARRRETAHSSMHVH